MTVSGGVPEIRRRRQTVSEVPAGVRDRRPIVRGAPGVWNRSQALSGVQALRETLSGAPGVWAPGQTVPGVRDSRPTLSGVPAPVRRSSLACSAGAHGPGFLSVPRRPATTPPPVLLDHAGSVTASMSSEVRRSTSTHCFSLPRHVVAVQRCCLRLQSLHRATSLDEQSPAAAPRHLGQTPTVLAGRRGQRQRQRSDVWTTWLIAVHPRCWKHRSSGLVERCDVGLACRQFHVRLNSHISRSST